MLDPVDVYFNLHKKLWSCKSRTTGRVVAHSRIVATPVAASLVVSQAGRNRVLLERRKNVHAFVRMGQGADIGGDVAHWLAHVESLPHKVQVSYNPYKGPSFYRKDTGAPLTSIKWAVMIAPEDGAPQVWAGL